MVDIFDLSPRLGEESCTFPGDPPFVREVLQSPADGADYELSALRMSAHAGAHIDAPAHFFPEGRRIGDYGAERFVLPVVVVGAESGDLVDVEALRDVRIPPNGGVLFRTRNSLVGLPRAGKALRHWTALSAEAAERCVALGARLVGIDAPSVDAPRSKDYPAHRTLLAADVLLLEGIDLADVPEGRFTLVALPLLVPDAEGAPTRAVLISHPA